MLSRSEISDSKFGPSRFDGGQPTWEKPLRYCSSVSKAICGMLNTGKGEMSGIRINLIGMSFRKVGDFSILGGKVYMGVDDEGTVRGFMMCPFQRDHFSLAMHGKNDW